MAKSTIKQEKSVMQRGQKTKGEWVERCSGVLNIGVIFAVTVNNTKMRHSKSHLLQNELILTRNAFGHAAAKNGVRGYAKIPVQE